MKRPAPTHLYVVTDPGDLLPPRVERFRFRAWARGGATVWDRGRIRYVRSPCKRVWTCGTLETVFETLRPILADRRRCMQRLLQAIARIERGELRVTDVPEGKLPRTKSRKI